MLLIHRRKAPHAGQWDFIGGKLESREDPFTACMREVREETGLKIVSPRLGLLLLISVMSTGELWPIFVFSAEAPQEEVTESDEGELAWVELSRIGSLPIVADIPLQISYLDRKRVTVIRMDYETDDASSAIKTEVLG